MPSDDNIIDRLRAALDSAEHLAQRAYPGPWRYNPRKQWIQEEDPIRRQLLAALGVRGEEFVGAGPEGTAVGVAATGPADDPQSMADAEFIAAWGPDRILSLVVRDRALLARLDLAKADMEAKMRTFDNQRAGELTAATARCKALKEEVERAAELWLGLEATDADH